MQYRWCRSKMREQEVVRKAQVKLKALLAVED